MWPIAQKVDKADGTSLLDSLVVAEERYIEYCDRRYPSLSKSRPDPTKLMTDIEAEAKDREAAKLRAAVSAICDQILARAQDLHLLSTKVECYARGFFEKISELQQDE